MRTEKPAKGVRGHIIDTFTGTYYFRVYDDEHNFIDYDLRHVDLAVIIDDDDAVLYEDAFGAKIDHSPTTLGKIS